MTRLVREGDDLVVKLDTWGKLGAVRGDVRVPYSSVREVRVLQDAVGSVKGMTSNFKWVGAYWPGSFAYGTFFNGGWKRKRLFAAATSKVRRGLWIDLDDAAYSALVLSLAHPEADMAKLFGASR